MSATTSGTGWGGIPWEDVWVDLDTGDSRGNVRRNKEGMDQREVARVLGISKARVQQIEQGALRKLRAALGCETEADRAAVAKERERLRLKEQRRRARKRP